MALKHPCVHCGENRGSAGLPNPFQVRAVSLEKLWGEGHHAGLGASTAEDLDFWVRLSLACVGPYSQDGGFPNTGLLSELEEMASEAPVGG